MRGLPLTLLVVALLAGCANPFLCSSEDCSYALAGVTGTARFAQPWNQSVAERGLRAAGFEPGAQSAGNATYLMAGAWNGRYVTVGPGGDPAEGVFLTMGYGGLVGHGTSRAEVAREANATWPSHTSDAASALAAFENATGWRHVGGWDVRPIEAIR